MLKKIEQLEDETKMETNKYGVMKGKDFNI